MGGLGNQMFQYAAGRSLAYRLNCPLLLDIFFLKDRTYRKDFSYRDFSLDIFDLKADILTDIELIRNGLVLEGYTPKHFISKLMRLISGFKIYVEEDSSFYNFEVNTIKRRTYLIGYFQCEKYFENVTDIIRQDFSFPKTLSFVNERLAKKILHEDSISIHIRRGDYVKNKTVNALFGVCNLEYYYKAIEMITNVVKNPIFYVFSDDLQWAEANLKIDYDTVFVKGNTAETSFEDMRLMSLCKHNIIANSSFSWWAAWLNNNESKMVIAPKMWFANKQHPQLPLSWIEI